MLNHPSRAYDESQEITPNFLEWRKHTKLIVGFEGAPGHQKVDGSYKGKVALMDRWDPVAAEVGGVWDQLLSRGEDVWAAQANSDFHGTQMDYWPGEFAETWLYVSERTPEGVLKALKAGSFFAAHGHVARNVELKIDAQGLPRPAYPGEMIEVSTGSDLTVALKLEIPATDWEGKPNHIDQIELIAITPEGTRVIADEPLSAGESYQRKLKNLRAGFVLRAQRAADRGGWSRSLILYEPDPGCDRGSKSFGQGVAGHRRLGDLEKSLGRGLVVLLASAMWVGISKYLDSREDLPADPKPLPMIPPGTPPKRRHVFVAAMGFLILAMYGSLVPLNPRPGTFEQAWEYFWHFQPWERPDFSNRSDWGANVLLFMPISFCWLGVVCLDKKGFLFKGICMLLVLAFCLAASLGIEFAQFWVKARVPSHNDVYAQVVGTLIGLFGWLFFGQSFVNWWRLHTSQQNRHRLLAAVLSVYVLGFVAYSVVPLDILFHPAELYKKYRDGRIVLVPHWPELITPNGLWGMLSDLIAYLPVGVWSALIWKADNRHRSWLRSFLIGGSVALGIEIAQVFVLSRFAEVSDLFPALLGVALGAAGVCAPQGAKSHLR